MTNSRDPSPALIQNPLLQQAVAHHRAGRLQDAERLYRDVLKAQPQHPEVNHNLGVLAVQAKRPAAGLPHLKAALEANPNQRQYWLTYIDALIQAGQMHTARKVLAQGRQRGLQGKAVAAMARRLAGPSPEETNTLVALFNQGRYTEGEALARRLTDRFPRDGFGWKMLGVVLKSQGRTAEALEPMRKAAILLPGHADAHNNLGITLKDMGRLEEAEVSYRRALEIDPDFAEAHSNFGVTLRDLGRLLEAEVSLRRALEIKPDYDEAHNNLGNILKDLERLEEAEASYRRALEIKPDYEVAHSNLGNTLKELGRLAEAETSYRRALEIRPDYAEAHSNLGNTLKEMGRLDEAEIICRRALEIKPDLAEAHYNLGNALNDQGRPEDAETSYRRALEIKPDYAEAHCNLGNILKNAGRPEEAEVSYRRALEIKPDFTDAGWNLSLLLLSLERFEEGWQLYESRYALKKRDRIRTPQLSFPQWQGESLTGRTLVVWTEQGLGDAIQFCRYLPILKKLGARHITLVCRTALKALLSALEGVDTLVAQQEADTIPMHDYWTFLLSVPLHCKTRIDTIPAEIPYLQAKQDIIEAMAPVFDNISGIKVGVCWKTTVSSQSGREKSPGINPFRKLFRLEGAHFFTLLPESRNEFVNAAGTAAVDLGYELEEFSQTAALTVQLDLVITCDTSVAHLAGALGKAVWIVLPPSPDWRWLSEREDSPWYPNVKLFRQAWPGDWEALLDRVASQLQAVIDGNFALQRGGRH